MADKRITDVDYIDSLNSDESFFINQNNSIKQINRGNIIFDIANGGTGANNDADARANLGITPENIGAATSSHNHEVSDIVGTVPISKGGTNADNADDARLNLGITLENIGAAASSHNHDASNITSGTLSSNRLPVVPVSNGGTGSSNGATGLKNLFAAGSTVLSSYQYGDKLPTAGLVGRVFLKKKV